MFRTLGDFRRQLRGSDAHLVPWIQDWGYDLARVRAQIDAARLQGAKGYLLWNAEGLYTPGALAAPVGGQTFWSPDYGASRILVQPSPVRS